MFPKKERGDSWPAQSVLARVRGTAEDSISVYIKRMRNFQLRRGRMSQYGSESWLTSVPCEKKTGHNTVVKLLSTSSEVKKGVV